MIGPLPVGAYTVLIPQAAQPGQPLVLVPVQPSSGTPTSGPRPGIATYLLERQEAGLIDIKVALQIARSLPLIVIPQQDTAVDATLPITIRPAPTAGISPSPTTGPGQPAPAPAPVQVTPGQPAPATTPVQVTPGQSAPVTPSVQVTPGQSAPVTPSVQVTPGQVAPSTPPPQVTPGQTAPPGGPPQPASASAPIQLIPEAPASFSVPFVIIAPLDMTAPLRLVIPAQAASMGIPLRIVPDDAAMTPPRMGDAGLKAREADGTSSALPAYLGVIWMLMGLGFLLWAARRSAKLT